MRIKTTVLALTIFTLLASATAFSGSGSGTSADPYIVTDCSELDEVRNEKDAYYKLGNSIDCSGNEFTSINDFSGSFNGSGYEISNFTINEPGQDAVGIFGHVTGGTVTRTGVSHATVEGAEYVGTLIGELSDGVLSYSYVRESTVTGDDEVGGLIGLMRGGNPFMTNTYAVNTTASGPSDVGGLIGQINDGQITKSYSISSADMDSGQGTDGVLLGKLYGGSVTNSYYLQSAEPGTSDGGEAKTEEEMQQQSTYTGWDFEDSWDRCETSNSAYPTLRNTANDCDVPPELSTPTPNSTNIEPGETTLSVYVEHPEDREVNISFYNSSDDSLIQSFDNMESDQLVTADWTGLSPDQSYEWYASASHLGSIVETGENSFTTITAEVEWDDEAVNEAGYRIFDNSTGSFLETDRTSPETESAVVASSGLSFGTYTCFRIRSYNGAGQSDAAEECVTP